MTEYDKRCCCLREIQQTEEKYTDTLGSIQQVRCRRLATARRVRGTSGQVPAHLSGRLGGHAQRPHLSALPCVSSSLSVFMFLPFPHLPDSSVSTSLPLRVCLFLSESFVSWSVCLCCCLGPFSLFPLAIAF